MISILLGTLVGFLIVREAIGWRAYKLDAKRNRMLAYADICEIAGCELQRENAEKHLFISNEAISERVDLLVAQVIEKHGCLQWPLRLPFPRTLSHWTFRTDKELNVRKD